MVILKALRLNLLDQNSYASQTSKTEKWIWTTVPYCVCSNDEHERYRLVPGDIVFARTGATTGKSYLIRNCPDAVFASYLIRLHAHEVVGSRYLAAFFESLNYWSQITGAKKGVAQPGVNATVLSTLRVPLAPLNEQRRIVDAIEAHFTRLDAVVAALKRSQANLQPLPGLRAQSRVRRPARAHRGRAGPGRGPRLRTRRRAAGSASSKSAGASGKRPNGPSWSTRPRRRSPRPGARPPAGRPGSATWRSTSGRM